jgi:hypothetical protein
MRKKSRGRWAPTSELAATANPLPTYDSDYERMLAVLKAHTEKLPPTDHEAEWDKGEAD